MFNKIPNKKKVLSKFNFTQVYHPKTKDDIIARIHKFNMNTITMGFPDNYGRFMGKKYDTDYFITKVLKNGSNACNYLLSCDMVYNIIPNSSFISNSFGDFTMKADLDSVREISYMGESRQMLLFSDLFDTQTDKTIAYAPRYLLRKVVQDLKFLGYSVQFECDINFNIFFEKYRKLSENFSNAQSVTEHSNLYNTIYNQNFEDAFNKIKNYLKISNVIINRITGDKAPGQFRVSLAPADCLEFCDNVTLFKLGIKKIADDNDKTVTFMSKLNEEWLGNSLAFKIIIKDYKGNNILDHLKFDSDYKPVTSKEACGEHAVSGIINHLSDFFIFYAPTVNSYRRLKEIHFNESWNKFGFMKDDCGVNIIEEKTNQKILFTLTGSDVNPYFAVFSLLSSIKSGIENKLRLEDSLNKIKNDTLPINLYQSLIRFKHNKFMQKLLGEEMHQYYWSFYNNEYAEFMTHVDEWELNRYLFNI